MIRRIIGGISLLLGLSVGVMGCASSAESVCALICECEHCNDYEEVASCDILVTEESVADAYDCSDQWEAYMTCLEDKGTCDEENADFNTSSNGSCSNTVPTGSSCATNQDCGFSEVCQGSQCLMYVCAGSGQQCETNADCPGASLCDTEQSAVSTCIDAASAHDGVKN